MSEDNNKIGATKNALPAIINIIPKIAERIIINNLIFFEIFFALALPSHAKRVINKIKIIIPKKTKFI